MSSQKLNNLPIKPVYKDDGTSLPVVGKLDPVVLSEGKLSTDEENIFRELEKRNNVRVDLDENKVIEFLKCRRNPFYFIHNYMQIEEVGGMSLYSKEKMNYKVRRYVKSLYKYHKCILLASRQLGKDISIKTPIPLYNGSYKTMEELNIGDEIYDHTGNKTKVIMKSQIFYKNKCYRLFFDNEEIIAGEDHLWVIDSFNEPISTKQLYDLFLKEKEIFLPYSWPNNKKIKLNNIEETKSEHTQCIQVDSIHKTFLCGKTFIPTHNSTISAGIIAHVMTCFPGTKVV